MTAFDPADHEKLREAFTREGVVGASLLPIHVLEEQSEIFLCGSFRGYRLLNQCFLAFFHDTLEIANRQAPGIGPVGDWYRPLVPFLATAFARARASEILYLHGYALEGFALLRDLKDRAILLAGVMHGTTTLPLILGFTAEGSLGAAGDYWTANREMVKRRKADHRATVAYMLVRDLPADVADHLRRWGELFDSEVHMSLHSLVHEAMVSYRSAGELRLGPNRSEVALSMYMNRSLEVSWALLRVLPLLQTGPYSHGAEWTRKWFLLDHNLKVAVAALADQASAIVPSLLQWFDLKLPFDPSWSYLGRRGPVA